MNFKSKWMVASALAAAATAIPASAQGATRDVTMGLPASAQKAFNQKLLVDVNDFFPHGTTIAAGDSVRFVPMGFHTADFPARGGGPLAFAGPNGQKVAGANDAAGNPFWFNGLDQNGILPELIKASFGKKLTYDGTKRVQSGLPLADKPKPMTVTFPKAGKFTYFCTIHPGMKGTVRVLPKGSRAPSATAHAKAATTQVARDLKIAKTLPKKTIASGVVDVGEAGPYGVEYFGFLPGNVTVPVGTTLRFQMSKGSFEAHTATAGPGNPEKEPGSYLGKLAASFESPAFDPAAIYPSDPPGAPAALTPTTHGNGFWNTGMLDLASATPPPAANSVKFTAPGKYTFYCLIHPFMRGTVTVQ